MKNMQSIVEALLLQIMTELRARGFNSEVAVFLNDDNFTVEACNPSSSVNLGESQGKFSAVSKSLEDAIRDVLEQITA